jgi:hypothetical protein
MKPLVHVAAQACFLSVLVIAPCVHGEHGKDERFVIQSVDVTKEGRRLQPPTPENPVYFIPVFEGYKELGGVSTEYEKKPSDKTTGRQLITMLEKQGYKLASRDHNPTLVLVFRWGSIVPVEVEDPSDRRRPPGCPSNQSEIRAYVIGERVRDVDPHSAHFTEMSSLAARHYLLISAFEFRRPDQKGEVLLWRAHVTTELWGNYLSDVLPLMIAHAAPILGRDIKPGGSWTPANARVIVGDPVVVPAEGK